MRGKKCVCKGTHKENRDGGFAPLANENVGALS